MCVVVFKIIQKQLDRFTLIFIVRQYDVDIANLSVRLSRYPMKTA